MLDAFAQSTGPTTLTSEAAFVAKIGAAAIEAKPQSASIAYVFCFGAFTEGTRLHF